MKGVEVCCLSCRFFRLTAIDEGLCRVDKAHDTNYPKKMPTDHCSGWVDCGQQYYIRVGWMKGEARKAGSTQDS